MRELKLYWWRPFTGSWRQMVLDTYFFAPRTKRGGVGAGVSWRLRNFGDELNPLICEKLLDRVRCRHADFPSATASLLGSVIERALQEARPGTVILGSGLSGPLDTSRFNARRLAKLSYPLVRGPLTRAALGLPDSLTCGDPGLLVGQWASRTSDSQVTLIVHFGYTRKVNWRNSLAHFTETLGWKLHVTSESPSVVIQSIARSRLVLSTSLHGIIVADSLGVPAIPITLGTPKHDFRFDDYHASLGMDVQPLQRLSPSSTHHLFEAASHRLCVVGPRARDLALQVKSILQPALNELVPL